MKRYRIGVLLLVTTTGCPNYATLQEADTLPKGEHRTGIGVTATQYELDFGNGDTESLTVPALNVWYRRGVTEKLEVRAAVWIPFGASIGGKYQLVGDRTKPGFALSAGLDVGALQVTSSGDGGMEEVQLTIVDVYVPLYVGYRLSPGMAVYVTPKYIQRFLIGDSTALASIVGGTLGIAAGEKTQFLVEGSVLFDLDVGAPIFQGGLGVAF